VTRTAESSPDVFINCPFSSDYEDLFDAIVFATLACGFQPRSALEVLDGGAVRLSKILDLIAQCRLSLSDIAGQDIDVHRGSPREAISAVRRYLNQHAAAPGQAHIAKRFSAYEADLPALAKSQRLEIAEVGYIDKIRIMSLWLQENA
jgi:hypothetical protein